jgi:hypothetical protein
MRIVEFILQRPLIDQILRHLRDKGKDVRAGPWDAPALAPGPAAP